MMTTYTITAEQRHALQAYLQTQCGLRCNAEYNPCEASELDQMLQSLTPNGGAVAWQYRSIIDGSTGVSTQRPSAFITDDHVPLYAAPAPAPQAQREPVAWHPTESAMAALRRFNETCEDSEGYDVPKDTMKQLAMIGLVHHTSGGRYGITDFGQQMLYTAPPAQRELSDAEIDAIWRSVDYTQPYGAFRMAVSRAVLKAAGGGV